MLTKTILACCILTCFAARDHTRFMRMRPLQPPKSLETDERQLDWLAGIPDMVGGYLGGLGEMLGFGGEPTLPPRPHHPRPSRPPRPSKKPRPTTTPKPKTTKKPTVFRKRSRDC